MQPELKKAVVDLIVRRGFFDEQDRQEIVDFAQSESSWISPDRAELLWYYLNDVKEGFRNLGEVSEVLTDADMLVLVYSVAASNGKDAKDRVARVNRVKREVTAVVAPTAEMEAVKSFIHRREESGTSKAADDGRPAPEPEVAAAPILSQQVPVPAEALAPTPAPAPEPAAAAEAAPVSGAAVQKLNGEVTDPATELAAAFKVPKDLIAPAAKAAPALPAVAARKPEGSTSGKAGAPAAPSSADAVNRLLRKFGAQPESAADARVPEIVEDAQDSGTLDGDSKPEVPSSAQADAFAPVSFGEPRAADAGKKYKIDDIFV